MKRLLFAIAFIIISITSFSQVSVYRYGSGIRYDGLSGPSKPTEFTTQGATSLDVSTSGQILILDDIRNKSHRLGLYTNIRDEKGGSFASLNDALLYLATVLNAIPNGLISEDNSTNDPLEIDEVFTGDSYDILGCGIIYINVSTDQVSATDGLEIQQSSDGVNWDHDDVYTVPAGGNKNYAINPYARYMRVVYTNGGVEQTHFRLQTVCKINGLASSHRIQDSIVDDDDARLVKAVLSAKFNGDGFGNITATASGNLRVTDAESGLAIASGDVVGTTFIHKFGNAPDFDTGDGAVTIWDGAEDGTAWENMVYDYSTSADIDSLSSNNASDTEDIEITGLDANYELVCDTVTLTGTTPAALGTVLIRVFRLKNIGSVDLVGHIFCSANAAITAGIPDDAADIRAIIQPGNNQTLMSIYTIPAGQTGYMRSWFSSIAGANKASSYVIDIKARPFGGVFQLKHKSAIDDSGTSYIQHKYEEPEVFLEKTDIEIFVTMQAVGGTAASISGGFDIVLKEN